MYELRNKKRVRFALLTVAAIVIVIVIAAASSQKIHKPPALIVLPHAKDVNYSSHAGNQQVRYDLTEKYPAKHILEQISDKLTKQGWKPLQDDFQNPGHPSSHVTGWTYFTDATRKPEQAVRRWHAQWSNTDGDIINYDLEYRWPWLVTGKPIDPKDLFTPNTDRLQVYGTHIPAKLAKRITPPSRR